MTRAPEKSLVDERDLSTAGRLQRMLLPRTNVTVGSWQVASRFQPAGIVSGDYVDLVRQDDDLYFMLGDVSGKGVTASLLMAQLHAMFRTLIPFGLSLEDLMTRASSLLCASSLPAQYATLVCGYLAPSGDVVISNAGHPPPLVITPGRQTSVRATGVPIGLFCESRFSATRVHLDRGDSLLMYSDGVTEATNEHGEEYGPSRVEVAAGRNAQRTLDAFVDDLLLDQERFRAGLTNTDDVTVLGIRRI